jgi:hypothetical protein
MLVTLEVSNSGTTVRFVHPLNILNMVVTFWVLNNGTVRNVEQALNIVCIFVTLELSFITTDCREVQPLKRLKKEVVL